MELLLDFSKDIDIPLLDKVSDLFYGGKGTPEEIKQADSVLNQLRDHPEAWTRAGEILQRAQNPQSKYLALAILDKLIKTRWKTLPADQRRSIRNFVATMCLEWSNDPAVFQHQRSLLNKANLTLVQLLKQEWPQHWPSFIPEIVAASRSGLEVCENNMAILRLLSEEVFDYSADQMTQTKAQALKSQLCSEFSEIFKLCHEVLENASRPSLIVATLQALNRYLSWIPLEFVFGTNLVPMLTSRFLQPFEYRNVTLKCLTDISALKAPQYDAQLVQMFADSVEQVASIVPFDANLRQIYATANTADQDFIQNLSLFLAQFLSSHLDAVERPADKSLLQRAHVYLLNISEIDEREVFKGCLDYWARLVVDLYDEIRQIPSSETTEYYGAVGGYASVNSTMLGGGAVDPNTLARFPLRTHQYREILSKLRVIVIDHMVRPEEVMVTEEDGEIVRVAIKENDTITLYKSLRDVLVYLTHLDVNNTEEIMKEKLERQVDESEWSWHKLNTLCWAIGSISGTMTVMTEKHFLVHVIKRLLELTDKKRGKDNKAVVASNIMYIVGQYPRFLRARPHWTFLKTVVTKLFEFMHETHEGVQDMACDTFMKIAIKCKAQFVEPKPEEPQPFIEDIIQHIESHISDLEPHQIQQFYEACGYIISAQPVRNTQIRWTSELMRFPNMVWESLINQFVIEASELNDSEKVKVLSNILRTNTSVCTSLGAAFEAQMAVMFVNLLGLYRLVAKQITQASVENPQFALTFQARQLRSVKKEILRLLETYIGKAENLQQVATDVTPPLLSTILEDYRTSPPALRQHEVLKCVTVVVEKVGSLISDMVLGILENVFENTLEMLTEDLTEYPEFRVGFFTLLRTINEHSFSTLLLLPTAIFEQTINACLWAAKHDNRDVEAVGLSVTLEIVVNIIKLKDPDTSNRFFKQFTRLILGDTFRVLTDPDHRSGFSLQSEILAVFVDVVETEKVTAPLYDDSEAPAGTSNSQYLRDYLTRSLKAAFPNLLDQQLAVFVRGMFTLYTQPAAFKTHLRDFLVQIKEFGGDDIDYFYAEERAKQLEEQQREQKAQAARVGGLINPNEIEDDE